MAKKVRRGQKWEREESLASSDEEMDQVIQDIVDDLLGVNTCKDVVKSMKRKKKKARTLPTR